MEKDSLFPEGLVKQSIIENQGKIIPITFDWDKKYGVSLMNPSIYNDNGIIKACVRCVNYTMHHAEKCKYPHWYGTLQYIHPENDVRLATENFLVIFNNDLTIKKVNHIDMLNLHKPIWGFHGLEDGRLFRWNDKLYICGVRRDTTDNGQGRMELTELQENENSVKETSRTRIPAPGDDSSYCEKNWMPILDQPNKFIIWSNPTNILTYNDKDNTVNCESNPYNKVSNRNEIRGGSQVIKYKDYYIAIGHDMHIWKPYAGEKDATYYSYIIVWDNDFNLITISNKFKFLNSMIEFCCGMCLYNDDLLISFSDEDNAAYILKVNAEWLLNKVLN